MNYMKEVAQMLGVEIGEEFELKSDYEYIIIEYYDNLTKEKY